MIFLLGGALRFYYASRLYSVYLPRVEQEEGYYEAGVSLLSGHSLGLIPDFRPSAFRAPNFLEVFFQMIYTMEYEVAQSRLDMAHVTMFPDLKGFSWTELHRAAEIIRAGELAAEEALPRLKALIPSFRP